MNDDANSRSYVDAASDWLAYAIEAHVTIAEVLVKRKVTDADLSTAIVAYDDMRHAADAAKRIVFPMSDSTHDPSRAHLRIAIQAMVSSSVDMLEQIKRIKLENK